MLTSRLLEIKEQARCTFLEKAVFSRRYDAPVKINLPFNIVGLVAFELFAMHFVETKRGYDFRNPGSQVSLD